MTIATASRPRPSRNRSRPAPPTAFAGDRPLDADDAAIVRFAVGRLDEDRALADDMFGSAAPTEEWLEAVERYRDFDGDDHEYDVACLEDRDLLPRRCLASYAAYVALEVAGPNSLERFAFSAIRSAETDIIRLILALNCPPDPAMARPNWISVDGRSFSYEFLDEDRDPRDARLVES